MTVRDLTREVLIRHLQAWVPAALHRGRTAVYVHGYADADGGTAAEAALRVFAEQSDLVRGRELVMLALGDDVAEVGRRLSGVPGCDAPGLVVHTVPGGTDARLPAALRATGDTRAPRLAYLDASTAAYPPAAGTLGALAGGKAAEVLAVLPAASTGSLLREAGFPLVTAIELATGEEPGPVLAYATALGRSLAAFKDTLWAVDEFAGVRYRDPGDPERHLIDISLTPHPGPLRREILAHLGRIGEATVTDLRTFALTETVYRAADATRVLHTLIDAGTVTRRPEHGRLGGDVIIGL
ncbi:hypothetical protein [Mangrovihabitans endophyticus]|uniref:Three-Cys-motif partner protein n=1 Tax=Mangrovihabitans endophyticus TaxID=1751298 RepID=A0A8J3FN42_9ACTN|nr:hypothetical protein [Mangrovihabitans endophyticus]GGK84246.1 hypothetical protein GCM10012284_18050 [Mangrovihabitans endophyticus]